MTMIDLDDLPIATMGPQGRPATAEVPPSPGGRRQFIGGVVRGATFVGLTGLMLFRSPRRAGAENPPWNEFPSCGYYDSGQDTPCNDNMCVGTSYELMDNSMCANNCADLGPNERYQWHKNRTGTQYSYRDYPGDICAHPSSSTSRDAWRWSVGACGYCNPAVYRCHDGEKRTGAGEWQFTICEGLTTCSGTDVACRATPRRAAGARGR